MCIDYRELNKRTLKQFRHYLLGRHFKVYSDHAPLQWLSAQKMEGLLCRWTLAIQEYDFAICYWKGNDNSNADALSRCPCATTVISQQKTVANIGPAQRADKTISTLLVALQKTNKRPSGRLWSKYPLSVTNSYGTSSEFKMAFCAESMYLGPCKRKLQSQSYHHPYARKPSINATTSLQQGTRELKKPWIDSEEKRTGLVSQRMYANFVETVRHAKPQNLHLPLRLH